MPLYGSVAHVEKTLRAVETWDNGSDVKDRLLAIQAAISLLLEERCGRTWGVPVSDTSELYWVGPTDASLVLRRPARSITSIRYGGTVSGSTMTGGTTILAADLVNALVGHDGLIHAIQNTTGYLWSWSWTTPGWFGPSVARRVPVVVTGDFADSDNDADVPADVTYAANILVAELFKAENASPAGFTGPDGSVVPIRDPWTDPTVKAVIAKYSLTNAVAV